MILEVNGAYELKFKDLKDNSVSEQQEEEIVEGLKKGNLVISMGSKEVLTLENLEKVFTFEIVDVLDFTEYSYNTDEEFDELG